MKKLELKNKIRLLIKNKTIISNKKLDELIEEIFSEIEQNLKCLV